MTQIRPLHMAQLVWRRRWRPVVTGSCKWTVAIMLGPVKKARHHIANSLEKVQIRRWAEHIRRSPPVLISSEIVVGLRGLGHGSTVDRATQIMK